jgi:ABC-2 type transport system permease protein
MELLYYLGVFAKADWVQLRNGLRKQPLAGCGLLALVVLLPIGGIAVVRLAEGLTAAALRSPFAGLLPQVPGGVVLLILLTALLNGTTAALQSIFLASDLEPLLATPAPMRAVVLARLLQSLALQLGLTVALGMALLVGYGLALGYGVAYFLALPLLLGLIACLPTGLGAILALLLIRIAPAGFTRDFVNVVNILLGLSGFALTQLLPRVRGEAMPLLSALNSPALPSTWAGQALVAVGEGRWGDGLPPGLAVAALSLAVFGGGLLLTEQQAANGIAEMAATRGGRRRLAVRATAVGAANGREGRPRSVALAIFRKELRTYPRDTANLQPLLFSLLMGGSWLWGALQGGPGMFGGIGGNVLGALSVATLVAHHPGLSAISREGPGLWQLQSAPVSGADVALGKLALAYLPYLVVGVPFLLVAGVLTRVDLAGLGVGALTVALLGWGCAALLTNLAFRFPRLEWKTTSQQVSTTAWFLSFPCLGLYVLIGVPLLLAHRGVPAGPGQVATLLASLGLAAGATWLLYRETLNTASRALATIEP